jgi:phenylpropionate dioxygenase-like ring-hydroxylating dioxygenase large terminal subunit
VRTKPPTKGGALARGLAPESYVGEETYAREAERVFAREWLCIGRVEDVVDPGDYVSIDIAGEPLVMLRDAAGALRVFTRICRHRAMSIVEGAGNRQSFICPYHAWTYGLDGRLIGAPLMDKTPGFERGSCVLPSPKIEVWEGFVFVNFDVKAKPLAPRLRGLSRFFEKWRFADMVTVRSYEFETGWNWKVMCENFIEAYHHIGAHRLSLEPVLPTRLVRVEETDGPYAIVHMGHARARPSAPSADESWAKLPELPGLTEEERRRSSLVHVFPLLLMSPEADRLEYYLLFPRGPARMKIRKVFCVPKSARQASGAEDAINGMTERYLKYRVEDVAINDSLMRGLHSRYAERGRLTHLERPLYDFRRYLERLMAGQSGRSR